MSKYSTTESKFRSFSPTYMSQTPSETNSLYERHRELIHQQILQLPNSPKSKLRIEQTFEEMLKSIHFFKKPDIIPFPYLNFERPPEEKSENSDSKYKDLLDELEKERNLRKIAERENANLRDRMLHLLEVEKQYEELRLGSSRLALLHEEIDKLNLRIQLLLDENEELRKRASRNTDLNSASLRTMQDLDKLSTRNHELLRELESCKDAYEELKKAYTRDVNSLKEKFDKLYSEKLKLELRLREFTDHQKPDKEVSEDNSIQEKIRNMKSEYRDKMRNLEQRLGNDPGEGLPDSRIKVIEDRIARIQEAIDHSSNSERGPRLMQNEVPTRLHEAPRGSRSRGSTPVKGKEERKEKVITPSSTWQSERGATTGSPLRSARKSERDVKSPGNTARANSSRSPSGEPWRSPSQRTLSRKRLYENHTVCETCVKRHGHEWAKSPR